MRQPKQKRSRERAEKILLAAADELAKASSAEDMTTTSVARRSGIPVSTIYRYFADRSAIIAALIDKETAEIDEVVIDKLAVAETVTIESLLRTIMYAHLDHFQAQRRSVLLWFGARHSKVVSERVNQRYDYLSKWIYDGGLRAGFVDERVPPWGSDAVIWYSDRTFELMFREERSVHEQRLIMEDFFQMMIPQIERFAPPGASKELTRAEFDEAFGEYRPPNSVEVV